MLRLVLFREGQDIQVKVALPIQGQDLPYHLQGHPLGRGLVSAPVQQPLIAPLLIALLPQVLLSGPLLYPLRL